MSELIIGGRRPGAGQRLRGVLVGLVFAFVVAVVSVIIFLQVVRYPEPDASVATEEVTLTVDADSNPQLQYGRHRLYHRGRVAVAELNGKPQELGAGIARLQSRGLSDTSAAFYASILATVPPGGTLAGMARGSRLDWHLRSVDDGIPGHQLVEVAGMAQLAEELEQEEPTFETLVRSQATLDIGRPVGSSAGHYLGTLARSLSVVAPLRADGGDRLLVGHSFALPGIAANGALAAQSSTLVVHRPEGVIPFAGLTWPGHVGVVAGINAEGIAVFVHPAAAADVHAERVGQPMALLARDLLENVRNLDEALSVLEHAKPLGAAVYLIADGRARRWAVVERSPTRFAVVRDPAPRAVTGLFSSRAFADDHEAELSRRRRPAAARLARARELLRGKRFRDPMEFARILRDRRRAGGTPMPLGHRAAIDDFTAAHTVILDATQLVIWVSEGPGAAGAFRAFDLRHLLRGEGDRPAPPADLAGDPDLAIATAEFAFPVEAMLAAGRQALEQGNAAHGAEFAARALARIRDYPAALRLAGDCARAQGRHEEARQFYQRYLDAGPEDPTAAEQLRAYLTEAT